MSTISEFSVDEGERVPFVLTWFRSHEDPPEPIDPPLLPPVDPPVLPPVLPPLPPADEPPVAPPLAVPPDPGAPPVPLLLDDGDAQLQSSASPARAGVHLQNP